MANRVDARGGMIALIVAISLVVVMGTVAVALDRLWLDSAEVELRTASEASVLAAAAAILDDSLLEEKMHWPDRLEAARQRAADVAAENFVAGLPLALDTAIEGDVAFGRLVFDETALRTRFVRTDHAPTTVVVTGRRLRSRSNPVGLFLSDAIGVAEADVVASAEATWDDRILGVRALEGVPVPALPLAILAGAPADSRSDTWDARITRRGSDDRYAFDADTRQVVEQPDGIPEIILRSKIPDGEADDANLVLIDAGSGLRSDRLIRQIERGFTSDDLASFGGELLPIKMPIRIASAAAFPESAITAFSIEIGKPRVCLLYRNHESSGSMGYGRVECVGLVAGRIMTLKRTGAHSCEIVFQPAVLTTRTAVLATERADDAEAIPANEYIYKVRLTQ